MSLKCEKFANHLDVKNRRRKRDKGSSEIRICSLVGNPNLQKVLIISALPRPCWNREIIYLWYDLDKAVPFCKEKIEK